MTAMGCHTSNSFNSSSALVSTRLCAQMRRQNMPRHGPNVRRTPSRGFIGSWIKNMMDLSKNLQSRTILHRQSRSPPGIATRSTFIRRKIISSDAVLTAKWWGSDTLCPPGRFRRLRVVAPVRGHSTGSTEYTRPQSEASAATPRTTALRSSGETGRTHCPRRWTG